MAVCKYCKREMMDSVGCVTEPIEYPDGVKMPQILSGADDDLLGSDTQPCHDCYAPLGTPHHPGCDAERCPRCKGQFISCGCLSAEDE